MFGLAEPEIALYRGDKLGGRYELQEFLGEGNVSFVFKVLDVVDNVVRAVKLTTNHPDDEVAHRTEAAVGMELGFFEPQHFPRYLGRATLMGTSLGLGGRGDYLRAVPYAMNLKLIVTEHVDGAPLVNHMKYKTCDPVNRGTIALQMLQPIAAAHEYGVILNDVSDDAYIRQPSGQLRYVDLSHACYQADAAERYKKAGWKGRASNTAPEDFAGIHDDFRSDIFAWGTEFHRFLTREQDEFGEPREPFPGLAPRMDALGVSAINPQFMFRGVAPYSLQSTLPSWARDIACKALALNPDKRYQSVHEVGKVLAERLVEEDARLIIHPAVRHFSGNT